ncbi:hypothetical protein EH223_07850 [candidate division KSB1 bacterium]|nr:hypothetical protein [candidate division KSB1 bacterium]RQW04290.1 MAG: hypothetical protein EH223_07850 [candidate division KSB1 bacterium]
MSECKHIKDLIIQRNIAPLPQKDERVLVQHMKSCTSCQAFERLVSSYEDVSANSFTLRPRDDIKVSLKRIMRTRAQIIPKGVKNRLAHVLASRKVLYKIAVATIILFLFILGMPQLKRSQHTRHREYTTTTIDSISLNVINLNQIIQIVDSQKVGVNLRQDTMLAKILYTL